MKKSKKFISVLLLCAVLLFSSLPVKSFASPTHTMNLSFAEEENGKLVISLILPESEKLTAIDFSLVLTSETAEIEALSTENTDLRNILYDFDNIPENAEENEFFTYTSTQSESAVNLSGFFLDSMTTSESFHFCDIIIFLDGQLTENDVLEFSYTLTCEECSKSESHLYSLLNKALSEKENQYSYPLGDADLDGNVNASDARRILRASTGLDSLSLEESPYADSDYDGIISSSDARYALRLSVGLEKTVMHSFDIALEEGKKCEEGGNYTFTCSITDKSFTMEVPEGGHLCHDTDCFNTGKCEICNEIIHPATGHKFDENGICTVCRADKALLSEATEKLIPLLEEISTYDTLADEALSGNKRIDFINYTHEATKSIKKAAEVCKGATGLEKVHEHLMTAYKIRFQAFVSLMDDNGEILSSSGNCNAILTAVKQSNRHIDYASYLYV